LGLVLRLVITVSFLNLKLTIMKKFTFFLLFSSLFIDINAQSSQSSAGTGGFLSTSFCVKNNVQIYRTSDNSIKRVWGKKLKFQIISESDDTTFVRFRYYNDSDSMSRLMRQNSNLYNGFVNMTNINDLFYFLKSPRTAYEYRSRGITWGLVVAPIKIRPKIKFEGNPIPLKLTTNVTIGPYFGYKYEKKIWNNSKLNTLSHSIIAFAAPYTSFTEINSSNSKDSSKSSTTAAAFSFGGGYLFEVSNKFQIGALIGWDYVGGELGEKWYYQGKSWLSFSIGFNFTK
jgi:hypothetical protein